ncbi:hypothetical protein ONZ51_g8186 [Trametes cubensis]|uniref:Uncharacterized protein n=1 Tax=Trametes cubensis TaxID=1111947 RepID=A0AAD7TR87_9APHY|nr:hypothetical protein ONZ51_g8186 [Trametes cubensis]
MLHASSPFDLELEGEACAAATSLYIPLLDPQPITADIEGVDNSGHTTWRIGPGVASGTLTEDSGLFTSATLVAGATDAHLVENDSVLSFAITIDCGLNSGIAACTAVGSAADIVSTATTTEAVSAFEVQVASTATGTGATASPTATSGQISQSLGSTPTKTSTGTDSGALSPTGGSGNGASAVGLSSLLVVPMVMTIASLL